MVEVSDELWEGDWGETTEMDPVIDLMGDEINVDGLKYICFPDGQPHFEALPGVTPPRNLVIRTRLTQSQDIVRLLCLFDCLYRIGVTSVSLDLAYVMGARMDRSILNGTLTCKVVADMLGTSPIVFDRITMFDPHSDVLPALLSAHGPVKIIDSRELVRQHIVRFCVGFNYALVAPDAGATKRVEAIAGPHAVIQGFKHRDVRTGALSGFSIQDHPRHHHYIIVDDICDGGGTFVGLAKAIREHAIHPVVISLVVSHGIFSKGRTALDGIDYLTTTDSYYSGLRSSVIPMADGKTLNSVVVPMAELW